MLINRNNSFRLSNDKIASQKKYNSDLKLKTPTLISANTLESKNKG